MALASKLWHSQWFEVGKSAIVRVILGQIWLFDHERSPLELSDIHAILFRIQNYMFKHIFLAIGEYLRILNCLVDLRQHDYHPNLKNSQISPNCSKNVSEDVILDAEQVCTTVWKLYRASLMVKKPNLSKNSFAIANRPTSNQYDQHSFDERAKKGWAKVFLNAWIVV